MERFRKVLLVVHSENNKEAATERAVTLAQENRAELRVVQVPKDLPREAKLASPTLRGQEVHGTTLQEQTKHLEGLVARIRDQGVSVTGQLLRGRPYLEIIREVLRDNHDLVITAAEEPAGLKDTLFGTTTTRLMRKCPCPVWVIKAARAKPFHRILAAVNPDNSHDPAKEALNRKIVELACSLAELEGADLHICRAWLIYGEGAMRYRVNPRQIDEIVSRNRAMYERALDELLAPFPLRDLKHEVHLVKGATLQVITDLAVQEQVELVVMGTVPRTGLSGLLADKTAEEVMHQLDCSILTVKPDGFVSPVRLKGQEKQT